MYAPESPLLDVTRSAILLVDDNPNNLAAFEASLDGLAADFVRATSGQQALRSLLDRDFAVVVLDVLMPDLDGFETARLIRARSRTHHVPIIFVTAYSRDDRQVLEAYNMGAVDFLFKPITPDVLRAKVSVFIELRRRADEIRVQAEQLREHQRREHERLLEEEKRLWAEAAMRKRLEELAQADQRKDEFLAMLGHELRNPLAPIVTGLELIRPTLLGTVESRSAEARAFETMNRQVRHLRRLVDDLLDVSRINCGKIELEPETLEVASVLDQAIATVRPAITERQQALILEVPPRPVYVRADAVRLTQVVANLLHNAAKYTRPAGQIRVTARAEDNHVTVVVEDNGSGIDADLLPSVFDIFVQKRTSVHGGLGLGLTLVRRLVELHGGQVTAASDGAGKGSTFTITLPRVSEEGCPAPAPAAPVPPPPSRPRGHSGPRRVVVVDDNEDIRETLVDLLTSWGYDVRAASDGDEGIDVIATFQPEIAFVDVGMPRVDGYEVARTIRRTLGPFPRLVAMTGFGRQSDREAAHAAGFDGYLVKPIDLDDIATFLPSEDEVTLP